MAPAGLQTDTPHMQHGAGAAASRVALFAAAAIGSIVVALLSVTTVDPDLWGHVRFGLDILRDGALHSADPYAFTSDRPWINHEWLAEVSFAAAFRAGGGAGLVIFKLLVLAVTGHFLVRAAAVTAQNTQVAALIGIALVSAFPLTQTVRPQIFSLLCFAMLMWLVRRHAATLRRRYLLALPLVFVLWVNSHGGWVLGGAVLTILLLGSAVRVPGVVGPALAGLFTCALATLLNPYGWELHAFLAETLSASRPHIGEWQWVPGFGIAGVLPWGIVTVAVVMAAAHGYARRHPVEAVLILGLGLASFLVVRLVGFYGIAATVLLSADADRWPAPALSPVARSSRRDRMATAMFLGIVTLAGVGAAGWNVRCLRMVGDWQPEPANVAYLKTGVGSGRLLTWFNWGEYAIWQLSPAFKVSFDGRRETVYSDAFIARHMAFYAAAPGWERFLAELRPDAAWLPSDVPVARQMVAAGWHVVHRSERAVVLAPGPEPEAPALARYTPALERCFPDP